VRDQILRTAADLFRKRGFPATTLDDIAKPLGMSKASLYPYFRAKEEIMAAISRETIESFTRELSLVLGSDLSPEDKLRRIVREHVRFVIANRSFLPCSSARRPTYPRASPARWPPGRTATTRAWSRSSPTASAAPGARGNPSHRSVAPRSPRSRESPRRVRVRAAGAAARVFRASTRA
jgi:AcrR family transcriptional regulator